MKALALAILYAAGAFLLGMLRPKRWAILLPLVASSCVNGSTPTGLECVTYVYATFDGETLTMPADTISTECER